MERNEYEMREGIRHWVRGRDVTACGLSITRGADCPWFTTASDPTTPALTGGQRTTRVTCKVCLEVHAKDPTYPVRDDRDLKRGNEFQDFLSRPDA
jgi:hypothetical protein